MVDDLIDEKARRMTSNRIQTSSVQMDSVHVWLVTVSHKNLFNVDHEQATMDNFTLISSQETIRSEEKYMLVAMKPGLGLDDLICLVFFTWFAFHHLM